MTKRNFFTWIFLIGLTVIAGLISHTSVRYITLIIMLLAILKFIGVAFNFMEMKKANSFWQVLIISYLVLFSGIVLFALL